MTIRMDLHCHSDMSDGTYTPTQLVETAVRAKIRILALTDHDTMAGVPEAMRAAEKHDVLLLPALEFDTDSPFELHILAMDVDPNDGALANALDALRLRRAKRNANIMDKLARIGMADVQKHLQPSRGSTTRLHIADAIVKAGYAGTVAEAFQRYLNPDGPGYSYEVRYSAKEVIALIKGASGIPVIAHPCKIRANQIAVVRELSEMGAEGIEAYYPSSTGRQTELMLSLAAQFNLLVTCGSDFHGGNRQGTPLGCAWRDVPVLLKTAEFFMGRHKLTASISKTNDET